MCALYRVCVSVPFCMLGESNQTLFDSTVRRSEKAHRIAFQFILFILFQLLLAHSCLNLFITAGIYALCLIVEMSIDTRSFCDQCGCCCYCYCFCYAYQDAAFVHLPLPPAS